MDKSVVEFLKSTKISYKEFDRLLVFFDLKEELVYKQSFLEVCNTISNYLKTNRKNLIATVYKSFLNIADFKEISI